MKPPTEKQAALLVIELLNDLFGGQSVEVRAVGDETRYDFAGSVGKHQFLAEYKAAATTAAIRAAIDLFETGRERNVIRIIIVPYMGKVGKELCERASISWMDLSGNAKIVAEGLRIWIEGRPNKFVARGRPPNVFAPKSSRVARQLLCQPKTFQSQAELARQTSLGDGYVSTIAGRLNQQGYLERNDQGAVRPLDCNQLLEAWREAYDFKHHRIIRGHIAARTGEELTRKLAYMFAESSFDYAATGLSAAWMYTSFAAYRLVTLYVLSMPPRALLAEIGFSEEPRGANLWLVVPDDDGVFKDCQVLHDVRCASPLQVYLDLKDHPERSREAATELRTRKLRWDENGN